MHVTAYSPLSSPALVKDMGMDFPELMQVYCILSLVSKSCLLQLICMSMQAMWDMSQMQEHFDGLLSCQKGFAYALALTFPFAAASWWSKALPQH